MDEDLDWTAERVGGAARERRRGVGVGEVDRQRHAAHLAATASISPALRAVTAIVWPSCGQAQRDRAADAAAAARDQDASHGR